MKNHREIFEALLAGKTLVSAHGEEYTMDKTKDLFILLSALNLPNNWSIKREPMEIWVNVNREHNCFGGVSFSKDMALRMAYGSSDSGTWKATKFIEVTDDSKSGSDGSIALECKIEQRFE